MGRYSYKNQPIIAQWNIARFAETLLPLISSDLNEAIKSVAKKSDAQNLFAHCKPYAARSNIKISNFMKKV